MLRLEAAWGNKKPAPQKKEGGLQKNFDEMVPIIGFELMTYRLQDSISDLFLRNTSR